MGSLEEALTVTTPTPHEPQSAAGVKPQSALTTSALESMPTSTTLVPTVEDGVEPQDIGWNRNDPEEEVETPDNARKHTNSGNSLTAAAAKRLTEAESSYLPLKTKYDADMNRVNAAGHRLDSGNSELMKRAERLMPQLHATACIATSSNASVPQGTLLLPPVRRSLDSSVIAIVYVAGMPGVGVPICSLWPSAMTGIPNMKG